MKATPSSISGLLLTTVLVMMFNKVASEDQFVASLTDGAGVEFSPIDERQVILRDKSFTANMYGADAEVQIFFKDKSTNKAINFVSSEVFGNNVNFNCQSPPPDADVEAPFNTQHARVCSFTPQRYFTNSEGVTEYERDSFMRIHVKKADKRVVVLRHTQPLYPQCNDPSNPETYNKLDSCEEIQSVVAWRDGKIHKPYVKDSKGTKWGFLVLAGRKYRLRIENKKHAVRVVNGIKLKVSGDVSRSLDKNTEEIDGGIIPTTSACRQDGFILKNGESYECEFIALRFGFIDIPLSREGLSKKKRQVNVTISPVV